jgi:hypothetical protein
MSKSTRDGFESVKDQIGSCGIWCGSCVVGNGSLQELSGKYREIAEAYDLKDWASQDFDYSEFSKGLESIQNLPLCPGCQRGGGNPDCVMRQCAREKQITGCTDCPSPDTCGHKEALDKMRSAALEAGLFVKTQKTDPEPLIQEWTAKLRPTWPSLILFTDED